MGTYTGSAAVDTTLLGKCVSPVPKASATLLMFCPASSVSIAAASVGWAVLSASMKLKMLVKAGVLRCWLVSTFQSGRNPMDKESLESAVVSYRSQRMDHTDD